MRKKQVEEKPKAKPVIIGEKENKIKGKIIPVSKLMEITMYKSKSTHYMDGAWLIPKSLVNYLVHEHLDLQINDADTKWKFKITKEDLVFYGTDYKNDKAVPSNKFEVLRAKNRTLVVSCFDATCRFNYGGQCTKGSIIITKEGKCGYLD